MIVDVLPVGVGCDNKSVLAFGETHRQFIAYLVGLFGGDLTGPERVPNLVGNYIIFLSAPGYKLILPFGQHKFCVHRQGTALVTADQLALLGLVGILHIVRAAFQTGRNGLTLILVQSNQACCGHIKSPPNGKCRPEAA